ncbi:Gfo/Idh/MocA family oxidoreductase [Streptomyces bobili]|jgi:dTDP-3,4-didehydro-2,6-dideoxy-alpha-D-glucose 3-reductase|uniref:Gfo/Idh/MocA family protein n=1 Tax=Streptomyces TaxID=1883 RepID=UPI002256AF94|nr:MULTISPECIES: Gfo/Idh/MocA family oxidoreductase [Streptomyces]MCX5527368.1 Gfo/Idh/MocA family oxidoreductase [Streptomyces bobili]MDX3568336.1 Gfo/Idh/MocA family oxidoreductase [Streptomyces sp. ID05-47C]
MPKDTPRPVLRIGVLGCADIAVRRILPAIVEHPSVRLVALASRDRARAERLAARFGCAAVTGYKALLDREDINAVYVPLPPGMHHEWVTEALAAGKHVLVEKPLSTTYAQSVELVAMAGRLGLALTENFMFLHHSQHEAVRAMAGEIGELRVFTSSFGVPPPDPSSFRHDARLGGGALLDVGVYPLRAAQLHLAGELDVLGACLRVDEATGVDVAGSALLSTATGVTAQLDFGFQHAYRSVYALWGSRGRLSVPRAFTPPREHRPVVRIEQQDRLTEVTLPADHQVGNALDAFASAVHSETVRASLGEALLRQALLVEQVRKAARVVSG